MKYQKLTVVAMLWGLYIFCVYAMHTYTIYILRAQSLCLVWLLQFFALFLQRARSLFFPSSPFFVHIQEVFCAVVTFFLANCICIHKYWIRIEADDRILQKSIVEIRIEFSSRQEFIWTESAVGTRRWRYKTSLGIENDFGRTKILLYCTAPPGFAN